jgi:hypothetical protein
MCDDRLQTDVSERDDRREMSLILPPPTQQSAGGADFQRIGPWHQHENSQVNCVNCSMGYVSIISAEICESDNDNNNVARMCASSVTGLR